MRTGASRFANLVTVGYVAILAIGVVVGLATRSAAWGVGVVAGLSVLAMVATVVAMLVLAVRAQRRD